MKYGRYEILYLVIKEKLAKNKILKNPFLPGFFLKNPLKKRVVKKNGRAGQNKIKMFFYNPVINSIQCVKKFIGSYLPLGRWLPIIPTGIQIVPAGIHVPPAGIEIIPASIQIVHTY